MTVVKRTTNELIIEDSDPYLATKPPGYSVRFVRDVAGEQVVSVQTLDQGLVGLDLQDILAVLSWLASAADVEQYKPGPLDDSPIECGVCGNGHDCVLCAPAGEESVRG